MKPVTFVNAKTLDEAVAALGATSKLTAGGTDLYGALKAMIYASPPDKLVSIRSLPGLSYIRVEGGVLKIGALTPLADIYKSSAVIKATWPILAQAAGKVGVPQLRNMGTIGGNLCQQTRCWYYRAEHNEFNCLRKGGIICYMTTGNSVSHSAIWPAGGCYAGSVSDTATALMAFDATIVTTKKNIAIKDFFTALGNSLDANEIIKEIQVPTPVAGTKQAFLRFAERKCLDFAEVSVAITATIASGLVSDSRIVLGAVSPMPLRATTAEALIKGKALTADLAAQAGAEAVKSSAPLPEQKTYTYGSPGAEMKGAFMSGNAYKKQIANVYVKRILASFV
jgi:xanthine dehydrogenase YagS FAD-binding subunit